MTNHSIPRIAKWPFLVSDAVLLGFAAWTAFQNDPAQGVWPEVLCFGAVALGAWVSVIPFLREYNARLRFAEADSLASVVVKTRDLELIKAKIVEATSQWQGIQEQAGKTLQGAAEINDRMSAMTREFQTFLQQAGDQEKNTLRLEVDKLKRSEMEWLQVLVRIMDYIYALHMAGVRSGQQNLIDELTQFQNACRDAARRMGLVPLVPGEKEGFDERLHQTPDAPVMPPANSPIVEVLATGFTFQAQLLRRALVRVAPSGSGPQPSHGISGTAGQLEMT
jgi:molecular chaperone GrpE (heat shock protein)